MKERIPKLKYESSGKNLSNQKDLFEEEKEGVLEDFEMMQKRKRRFLIDAFETLFGATMGGTYAERNEELFSGDGAPIYVLVSMKNEKGEEIPELVKVGWGEFSKQTFESDRYPAFKNFPFDIYCVSQKDSYFADEKLKEEMIKNPQKYLSEHSLFVATNGKVQEAERIDFQTRRLNKKIHPIPYDEMLCMVRNQIINERTTPEEFSDFLQELPDHPTELYRYIKNLDQNVRWLSGRELEKSDEETKANIKRKYLMGLLLGMGIEHAGVYAGDKRAMESILALKKQFDFETNSFK